MNMTPEQALAELLETGSQQSAPEVNAILRSVWPDLRAPQRSHRGADLVALFRRAGYVSDGIPQPDTEITVYRGELVNTQEAGISWTANLETAKRYAQGYATAGHAQVVQAIASPAAVLARFAPDAEVVVIPVLLRSVEIVGYIPHFTLPRLAPF
jgi:hypothetical protein